MLRCVRNGYCNIIRSDARVISTYSLLYNFCPQKIPYTGSKKIVEGTSHDT